MSMQLTKFAVNFREAICVAIPSLVDLLKDRDEGVRSAAVPIIVELAEHGEFDWDLMGA